MSLLLGRQIFDLAIQNPVDASEAGLLSENEAERME